ncbi:MAG: hypothetical protein AAGI54_04140 [Planctomycetota bacterium]
MTRALPHLPLRQSGRRAQWSVDFRDGADLKRRMGAMGNADLEIKRAFARTGRKTHARMIKRVRSLLNLKTASIRSRVRLSVGERRGSRNVGFNVRVGEPKGPPNLASYMTAAQRRASHNRGGKPTRRGLRFRTLRGGPIETIPEAFVVDAKSGTANDNTTGRQIAVERQVRGGRRVPRRPFIALFGRSPVALLLHEPGFAQAEQRAMADTLVAEVDAIVAKRTGARRARRAAR